LFSYSNPDQLHSERYFVATSRLWGSTEELAEPPSI
jgi:hypothetical protein